MMMKKLLTLICFAILFTSCVSHLPITGKYETKFIETEIEGGFEETWSSIVEILAKSGTNFRIIDKSSGLITTEKTSFTSQSTYEVKFGKPNNPNAFILTSRTSDNNLPITYKDVFVNYNVLVKPISTAKSMMMVNLYNISIIGGEQFPYKAVSLGNFEKRLAEMVKESITKK